jgi:hypothetical protein
MNLLYALHVVGFYTSFYNSLPLAMRFGTCKMPFSPYDFDLADASRKYI